MFFTNKLKTFFLLGSLLFAVDVIIAQSTPNPCDFEKVTCGDVEISALLNSFDNDTILYALPGRSMPFWFAFGDSETEIIDTSFVPNFDVFIIKNEPGTPSTHPIWETRENEYYTYLTDVSFSEAGTYSVSFLELFVSFIISFFSAMLALSFLIKFLSVLSFTPYVIYRIALGFFLLWQVYS